MYTNRCYDPGFMPNMSMSPNQMAKEEGNQEPNMCPMPAEPFQGVMCQPIYECPQIGRASCRERV